MDLVRHDHKTCSRSPKHDRTVDSESHKVVHSLEQSDQSLALFEEAVRVEIPAVLVSPREISAQLKLSTFIGS